MSCAIFAGKAAPACNANTSLARNALGEAGAVWDAAADCSAGAACATSLKETQEAIIPIAISADNDFGDTDRRGKE
jgi:hypothetical protein